MTKVHFLGASPQAWHSPGTFAAKECVDSPEGLFQGGGVSNSPGHLPS